MIEDYSHLTLHAARLHAARRHAAQRRWTGILAGVGAGGGINPPAPARVPRRDAGTAPVVDLRDRTPAEELTEAR